MQTATLSNTQPSEVVLNGANVTQLIETIHAIQQNSAVADFVFRAHNQWIDGGHNQTTVNQYYGACQDHARATDFRFDADEPPVLLGRDLGANPVEYLLTALAACMTTTLAYQAALRGIEVESIDSNYEGDLDLHGFLGLNPEVRNGYKEIRTKFRVRSEADAAKLEELVRMSPVFDVISNPVPVRVEIEKV